MSVSYVVKWVLYFLNMRKCIQKGEAQGLLGISLEILRYVSYTRSDVKIIL